MDDNLKSILYNQQIDYRKGFEQGYISGMNRIHKIIEDELYLAKTVRPILIMCRCPECGAEIFDFKDEGVE